MTSNRFYVDSSDLQFPRAVLRGKEHHHLARVSRIRPGQAVWLIDSAGSAYQARVERIDTDFTELNILEAVPQAPQRLNLILAQAVLKQRAMEWVLQKSTELGVSLFVPILATRTVVKMADRLENKRERWTRIMREAAKQCGRVSLPELMDPLELDTWLGKSVDAHLLVLQEGSEMPLKEAILSNTSSFSPSRVEPGSVVLLVGPEGGWTKEEQKDILEHGYGAVDLGSNILRAETAALSGLAIISHFWNT